MRYRLKFDKINMAALGEGVYLYKCVDFVIYDSTRELMRKLTERLHEKDLYSITYVDNEFGNELSISYILIDQLTSASTITMQKPINIELAKDNFYSVEDIETIKSILDDIFSKCEDIINTEYSTKPTKWPINAHHLTLTSNDSKGESKE